MARSNFPAKLGDCIDLAYNLRAKRKAKEKEYEAEIEKMKAEEQALKDYIIQKFKKSEINGAKGKICTAAVTSLDKYRPKDFLLVWKWAIKNDAPQIFEKRLTQSAMQELVANGVEVPGVETYTLVDLSLTKV